MEKKKIVRDSFIFYRSFFNSLEKCPSEIQLPLFKAIARYALDYSEPDFSDSSHEHFAEAVWEGIKPQLQSNYVKFINGCKGAEFGKLGGAPKGNQNARKSTPKQPRINPKTTPNVNVNVNENVNENVKPSVRTTGATKKLTLPFSSDRFRDTWDDLCSQPKWKKKSFSALEMTLKKLSRYEEDFAILMMEDAIANNWQGVEFAETPKKYEQWKQSRPQTEASSSGRRPSRPVII